MKTILAACTFFLFLTSVHAQSYSRVRVYANATQMEFLHEAGVCLDHGKQKPGMWVETDLSAEEIAIIQNNGINTEVLIEDVQAYYLHQASQRASRAVPVCGSSYETFVMPAHFKYGSMGGYPTYAQVMSELDSMFILYPTLVKQKTDIAPHITHDGNTIDWMKISDNANTDENEPEILFTALHHSREPASVQQLLYFMWYMLENYGSDPEITWLLDHTEIYFVPVVNPDGYLRNEATNPSGGGMWRKNRRNNGDGTYGVDLNRNYGYQWGVSGTSGTPGSDVYKGPAAFSEPETKAIRDFTIDHDFKIALNYHTFGNLLLHPFGYGYVTPPDADRLTRMGNLLVSESELISQQAVTLYPASGDSDDWMYGDLAAKPRVFAFTPEIGADSYGFWPPMSVIDEICMSAVFQNITAVKLVHYYCRAKDANNVLYRNGALTQYFKYDLEKLGLADTGTSTVNIVALSPYVISTGASKSYTDLTGFTVLQDSIVFTLDPETPQGAELEFILNCVNPTGVTSDTVVKYFGIPFPIVSTDFTAMPAGWTSSFAATSATYVSPGVCITDSPGGNYGTNASKTLTTSAFTIPPTALFAQLRFFAKWSIEDGYDFAQVMVSTDGTTYVPLCGKYTNTGTGDQSLGQPLYDGSMSDWVMEEMNLNDYIGQEIRLRLRFKSDGGVNMDGFYMDDLIVEIVDVSSVSENDFADGIKVWPNPATAQVNIENKNDQPAILEVTDVCGKSVETCLLQKGLNHINTMGLENGYYLFRIMNKNQNTTTFKINILH